MSATLEKVEVHKNNFVQRNLTKTLEARKGSVDQRGAKSVPKRESLKQQHANLSAIASDSDLAQYDAMIANGTPNTKKAQLRAKHYNYNTQTS